jgi:DNA-binding ferritin-like protein
MSRAPSPGMPNDVGLADHYQAIAERFRQFEQSPAFTGPETATKLSSLDQVTNAINNFQANFVQILRAEIQPIKEDLKTIKEDLTKKIDTVTDDLKSVKEDLKTVKEDLKTVKEDLKPAKENLTKKIDTVIDDLKSVKEDLKTVKEDLTKRIDSLETSLRINSATR